MLFYVGIYDLVFLIELRILRDPTMNTQTNTTCNTALLVTSAHPPLSAFQYYVFQSAKIVWRVGDVPQKFPLSKKSFWRMRGKLGFGATVLANDSEFNTGFNI